MQQCNTLLGHSLQNFSPTLLYNTSLQNSSPALHYFSTHAIFINLHHSARSNPSNAKHNRSTDYLYGDRTSQHKACNTHYSALSKPRTAVASTFAKHGPCNIFLSPNRATCPRETTPVKKSGAMRKVPIPYACHTNSEIAPFQSLQQAPHGRTQSRYPKHRNIELKQILKAQQKLLLRKPEKATQNHRKVGSCRKIHTPQHVPKHKSC